jgi:hypothetical protein
MDEQRTNVCYEHLIIWVDAVGNSAVAVKKAGLWWYRHILLSRFVVRMRMNCVSEPLGSLCRGV